ncbi:hypothetical protein ACXWTF_12795 [Thiomicrolovo sp. ZZH C-3]
MTARMDLDHITRPLMLTDLLHDVKSWATKRKYLCKVDEISADGRHTFTWVASNSAYEELAEDWLFASDQLYTFLSKNRDAALELGYLKQIKFKSSDGTKVCTYRVTGKAVLKLGHLLLKK